MFYIAFMKPFATSTSDRCVGSCMQELQTAVGTIFLTQLAIGNIIEVGIPAIKSWINHKLVLRAASSSHDKKSSNSSKSLLVSQDTEMSEVETAFMMEEYDVMLGPFNDFAELVIQFGFTTMFVAAFPLASLMSYVNNYVELRVDGWKLCELCRRPQPRSCEDIGTWYTILDIIATICVFTNSAIVAYTGSILINYSWFLRASVFFGMSAGIFAAKLWIAYLITDVTPDVAIQLKRQDLITGLILEDKDYDSDDEDSSESYPVPPIYSILYTDNDPL